MLFSLSFFFWWGFVSWFGSLRHGRRHTLASKKRRIAHTTPLLPQLLFLIKVQTPGAGLPVSLMRPTLIRPHWRELGGRGGRTTVAGDAGRGASDKAEVKDFWPHGALKHGAPSARQEREARAGSRGRRLGRAHTAVMRGAMRGALAPSGSRGPLGVTWRFAGAAVHGGTTRYGVCVCVGRLRTGLNDAVIFCFSNKNWVLSTAAVVKW